MYSELHIAHFLAPYHTALLIGSHDFINCCSISWGFLGGSLARSLFPAKSAVQFSGEIYAGGSSTERASREKDNLHQRIEWGAQASSACEVQIKLISPLQNLI